MSTATKPNRTYTSLDRAYDHFNSKLFGGLLPRCLITMTRHKRFGGYYSHQRFANLDNPGEVTDEIALNPVFFTGKPSRWILSILVHEMAHLWQYHFGKPSRGGYHNKEWGAKMREVGLPPTNTGKPGGKDTGQRMSHVIDADGPFDRVCTAYLATAPAVLFRDVVGEGADRAKKKAESKTKYTCPACGLNAWAKPDAHLGCVDCGVVLEAEAK